MRNAPPAPPPQDGSAVAPAFERLKAAIAAANRADEAFFNPPAAPERSL